MYKIDFRLKTLFPAIMGTLDESTDVEFRVIAENDMNIDKTAVVTAEDVLDDIYGVQNVYAYKNTLVVEVKKDLDEDYFSDEEDTEDEVEGENPYAYFDTQDDRVFYDGPTLVVNNQNKKPEQDIVIDDLSTCYLAGQRRTQIIIVYHYKDNNKPLQAQFYLNGDKTMLTKEEILRELNNGL